jgi:acetolactate synthase-1/3 small subunit
MKKPAKNPLPTIFSIYAEDKKGLVGQVLIHFNKRSYEVISLNVARTDISGLVMLTLEAVIPGLDLLPFVERLKKIVEVYAVQTFGESLKKTGFYRLNSAALNTDLWALIGKYGAQLSSMGELSFVVSKTGSDADLSELYSRLEGPHLLGFCKSGLIVEESLVPFEEL